MQKIIILIIAIVGFTACKNNSETFDEKSILEEINSHKMEIKKIENDIKKLEKKLSDSSGLKNRGSILVGTEIMEKESFTHYLDITGSIEAENQAFISPEINGIIKQIFVREGDYVAKGERLAILDTDVIRNTIEEVKTQLNLAKAIYKKQKQLWDQKIGSEIQYLQAKANKESLDKKLITLKTQLSMANIDAPFAGHIEKVAQKVGEFGSPNMVLFYLVNLNNLKIKADISESFIPYISKNDSVLLTFPTFPDISVKSNISVVGSVVNQDNRTIQVQIPMNNPKNKLKPNMIARIKIADLHFDSAFVVPSIVVKNDASGKNYIYITVENNGKIIAKKQYIIVGKSYGNKTMIIKGIDVEDAVITLGYNLVKNGSAIRLVK